ncbi:MAG: hypothetical protein ACE5GA_06085, partial [Candidatus Zixiibacteriota bacterium]
PNVTSPLSDMKSVIIRSELECISCVKNVCPETGERNMRCMRQISVSEVFDRLRLTLSSGQSRGDS